jgi:Na+/H+-translocating membrane pyrophosphatase
MCLSAWVYRRGEAEWPQLLDDVTHVVVEVTTDDDRSIGVLSDNVSDNLSDSDGPVLQVLLFSWLEITVENLDVLVAELQLSPTEECAECLHQLEASIRSRGIPASATSSLHGLERPEPIEV